MAEQENRDSVGRRILLPVFLTAVLLLAGAAFVPARAAAATVPHSAHVFVIEEENYSFEQIVGNPNLLELATAALPRLLQAYQPQ